ncbi:MAG: AbrB/MazE/SpoVT family DNA-binding domain-containing protein [Bacteroidota bacterium]|jgi:antitoxin MazE
MELQVIDIGNSKGIRLNKMILEKYGIRDKVEVTLEKGRIILKPMDEPRKGWDKTFESMHALGDDQFLISDVFQDEHFE